MATLRNAPHLDPTSHNELSGGKITRNTKGTPNDAFAQFNFLPPGMKIEDTGGPAVDVKHDELESPQAPLFSSSERYTKGGK